MQQLESGQQYDQNGLPMVNPIIFQNAEHPSAWKKYATKKNCAKGYGVWVALMILSAFMLYLDFRCDGHRLVPKSYFYVPSKDSELIDKVDKSDCVGCKDPVLLDSNGIPMIDKLSSHSQKHFVTEEEQSNGSATPSLYRCNADAECHNGVCTTLKYVNDTAYGSQCNCNKGYITVGGDMCDYQQIAGLTALLLSIFVGGCGIDLCFMARGNGCMICAGVAKGLTLSGMGIWWLVDVILIATAQLPDGNGQPLSPISS